MYYYNHMFNPQWVNPNYYNSIKSQIDKYNFEQNNEVVNAAKAMRDLCKAVKKLDDQHQQTAFMSCLAVMAEEFGWQA